jgi:hypothetical protein
MFQKLVVHAGRDRGVSVHMCADNSLVIRHAAAQEPLVPLPDNGNVDLAVHPACYSDSAAALVELALERSAFERTEWRLRPSFAPRAGDPVGWADIEASVRAKFGRSPRVLSR